jgi:hypothetical protein
VLVAVRGTSGPARAAAKLGQAVDGSPDLRAFDVRRGDTFVRWLLSSAGARVPVDPPAASWRASRSSTSRGACRRCPDIFAGRCD